MKYKKPPLNTMAGLINQVVLDGKLVGYGANLNEIFTFSNVIRHKVYRIKFYFYEMREKLSRR